MAGVVSPKKCRWCGEGMDWCGTSDKGAWMCRICDLYPHATEPLTKTQRMNIAKTASVELELRERRMKGKG